MLVIQQRSTVIRMQYFYLIPYFQKVGCVSEKPDFHDHAQKVPKNLTKTEAYSKPKNLTFT